MTNFARIIADVAVDVSLDPETSFHPDIAAQFVTVPDEVSQGWVRGDDGTWAAPVYVGPPEPAPVYPKVGPLTFKLLFTAEERVQASAMKATDAYINDFWVLLDDPRTDVVDLSLLSVQSAIRHTLTVIGSADVDGRMAQILTGIPQ